MYYTSTIFVQTLHAIVNKLYHHKPIVSLNVAPEHSN